MAIKINLYKPEGEYDPGASKLFGAPVVPEAWEDKFYEDIIFFGQIRLSDIAELDTENRLPHKGYLYLFIDTEMYPYQAMAEYYPGEPNMIIEDFNELDPEFEHLNKDWLMSFEPCDDYAEGNRLFGMPLAENCEEFGELLLQYDPYEVDTGFLTTVDGRAFFFFGKDPKSYDNICFHIDYT